MPITPLRMLVVVIACSCQVTYTEYTEPADDRLWRLIDAAAERCPSFCDANEYYYNAKTCPFKWFCCSIKDKLDCCSNHTLRIDGIKDNYNCYDSKVSAWLAAYWKIVLGVCLPVGVISVIAAITLCSVQSIRQRRHRHAQTELQDMDRTRSNSAVSSVSGSSASSGRLAAPVVVVTPEETAGHLVEIQTITSQLQSTMPPPYTNDKPPQYADVYPG